MRSLNQLDLSWCVRRLPKDVRDLIKANPGKLSMAGGFIRAVIAREEISDIDLFSDTPEHAREWANKFNEKKGRGIGETDNAYTVYGAGLPVQFIHRWVYDKPEAVISSFDFSICAAAIWWEGNKWVGRCSESFYEDLAAKRLVYLSPKRDEAAGGSLLRVLKYYARGYRIPMPSFAAVLDRIVAAIDMDRLAYTEDGETNKGFATREEVILGLLREVDPLLAEVTSDPNDHKHVDQSEETGLDPQI
jgi:hypothetical protein